MNGTRGRRVVAFGAVVAGLLASSAPARATYADEVSARAAFDSVIAAQSVPSGWTGSVDGCKVGTESQESLDATLTAVNVLRSFAGVGPVTFSQQKNQRALAAALMMLAANDLSHDPGTDWPCHSAQGDEGAQRSNLFLGLSGAAAMVGYVDDSGVPGLGHRRWLIDPVATEFGSGSTGSTNALYVTDSGSAPVSPDEVVAWPGPGWFPGAWIFQDWSVAIGNLETVVDVSAAKVTVTVDGAPASVSNLRHLKPEEPGFYVGTGETLAWNVALPDLDEGVDHHIEVAITGVIKDGAPFPVNYAIDVFGGDASQPPQPPRFVKAPKIAGGGDRIEPGDRLRAAFQVDGAESLAYRWLCNGKRIRGADARRFRVKPAQVGCRLKVKVIARSSAGKVAATSPAVRVRRPR